jgi:hypothetical protein
MPKVTAQPGVWLAHHTGVAERGNMVLAVSILTMTLPLPLEALGAFGVLASLLAVALCLLGLSLQDGVDIPEERKRRDSPHSLRRPPKHLRPQLSRNTALH